MEKFVRLSAKACPLALPNLNTDQILPARYLKWPRSKGLGTVLFQDLRHDVDGNERPDFPLNREVWRGAKILVAGRNFGGGSSREAAVYALYDAGIRCVVAPSFGDIFAQNAVKNGLLTAIVPEADAAELARGNSRRSRPARGRRPRTADDFARQSWLSVCCRSGQPQPIAQRLGRYRSDRQPSRPHRGVPLRGSHAQTVGFAGERRPITESGRF